MVKKLQKGAAAADSSVAGSPLAATAKESAQQIWLAGLGAFSRAQEEGGKVFDTLVKEGLNLQRKTQSVAEEKLSEATNKMTNMATDISAKAAGQWDKLETIFEDRVAKALNKLGVPSAKDVDALMVRIDELNKSVQQLMGKPAAKPAPKPAPKPAAKAKAAPAAKRSPARKKAA
jgi:poly(hydroxyalkanoate) granule-associated protein